MSRRSSSNRSALEVRWSTRSDGDFHRTNLQFDELERRRRRFVDLPWTMLDQRHGVTAVRVASPGDADGAVGDIAITDLDDAVLGCWVGDCAPLVLVGTDREFATVHAGWRGLAAGVIDVAIQSFDEPVERAVLGPTIGACCYEFGADDLERVAAGVRATPNTVSGVTTDGRPALDVTAAVIAACRHHKISVERTGGCTGCTHDGFSHRVRREPQRHVVAAWRPASGRRQ